MFGTLTLIKPPIEPDSVEVRYNSKKGAFIQYYDWRGRLTAAFYEDPKNNESLHGTYQPRVDR